MNSSFRLINFSGTSTPLTFAMEAGGGNFIVGSDFDLKLKVLLVFKNFRRLFDLFISSSFFASVS